MPYLYACPLPLLPSKHKIPIQRSILNVHCRHLRPPVTTTYVPTCKSRTTYILYIHAIPSYQGSYFRAPTPYMRRNKFHPTYQPSVHQLSKHGFYRLHTEACQRCCRNKTRHSMGCCFREHVPNVQPNALRKETLPEAPGRLPPHWNQDMPCTGICAFVTNKRRD